MGVLVVVALVGGFVSGSIASGKGLSFGGYFILGALLPLIGVIVAAAATPAVSPGLMQLTPATAEGWWPDPSGRFDRRYFDGRHWTKHVTRDAEQRQLEDPLAT